MPGVRSGRKASRCVAASTPRWWNTLAFRLGIVVNLAVVGVLGAYELVDHGRQEAAYLSPEIDRLREEARVLRVAWTQLPNVDEFQRFLDQFCRQMSSAASPGHHIAVFDEAGTVVVRAHERPNSILESMMAAGRQAGATRFRHEGDPFVSVSLPMDNGAVIAVAQSLAPGERLLRVQRVGRATSTAILVVLIFGLTTIALLVWVRDPLRRLVGAISAVRKRQFDVRVRPAGSAELRYLSHGFNDMIRSLERVERDRTSRMIRAQEIQQALLPRNGLQVDGFNVSAVFLPTERVGGDLYGLVSLPDGSTLLSVFDVSGHGVPAALGTALLRTVLRHQASACSDLRQIAQAMNRELSEIASSGMFASCLLVRLSPDDGRVDYVNAGHDPAVVVRTNGELETTQVSGLVLGVDCESRYELSRVTLEAGDRIYLFTDGIHEVFKPERGVLGRERLAELLCETSPLPLEEQLKAVVLLVQAYQQHDSFDDDVTLVAACRK